MCFLVYKNYTINTKKQKRVSSEKKRNVSFSPSSPPLPAVFFYYTYCFRSFVLVENQNEEREKKLRVTVLGRDT